MGHAFVGQCSLMHILCSEKNSNDIDSLFEYCAMYWPKHIIAANCEVAAFQQMKELFVPTSPSFQHWVDVYNQQISGDDTVMKNPLQCAALHGLSTLVECLLPSVVTNVEIADALYAGAKHGHLAVVDALVNNMSSSKVGKVLQSQYRLLTLCNPD